MRQKKGRIPILGAIARYCGNNLVVLLSFFLAYSYSVSPRLYYLPKRPLTHPQLGSHEHNPQYIPHCQHSKWYPELGDRLFRGVDGIWFALVSFFSFGCLGTGLSHLCWDFNSSRMTSSTPSSSCLLQIDEDSDQMRGVHWSTTLHGRPSMMAISIICGKTCCGSRIKRAIIHLLSPLSNLHGQYSSRGAFR